MRKNAAEGYVRRREERTAGLRRREVGAGLTIDETRPGWRLRGQWGAGHECGKETNQAELETRRAVSTVPPRTTSFIPSTTELLATLPTKGCTRDLSASMARAGCCVDQANAR